MRSLSLSPAWRFLIGVIAVLIVGSAVRLYGLDWDDGTHLHPDERYLTMVVSAVRFPGERASGDMGEEACEGLPACLKLYWDTSRSPLNPANHDQFATYVYGTLPLFTTRAVAQWVDGACAELPALLPSSYRTLVLGESGPCFPGHFTGYGGIHLVGRSLSTLADLLTLLGLILLTRSLTNNKTALLAGLLYAFAVLPIQHAHFFVVDSFATVFVVWALVFAVRSMLNERPWLLVLSGLVTGLAVASKISVWPLATIVGLAGLLQRQSPDERSSRLGLSLSVKRLGILMLAGLAAALAFRAAQPYAFAGPGFWNVGLNEAWVDTMRNIRDLMGGRQDVPYGHQWTARRPILFPWRNMVVWGLGLPLGLAAWLGWGWLGWDLLRGKQRHLLVWVWSTGFFLYQATQWVKSMRYLLPVYPLFVLFAAWALVRLTDLGRRQLHARQPVVVPAEGRDGTGDGGATLDVSGPMARLDAPDRRLTVRSIGRRLLGVVALSVPLAVIAGTALWCIAFLSVYTRPLTRIAASEWLYDNVLTAVVLQTPTGPKNVPWGPNLILSDAEPTLSTTFRPAEDVTVTGLRLPKVIAETVAESRILTIAVGERTVTQQLRIPNLAPMDVSFTFDTPVDVVADQPVALSITLSEGPEITLKSAVIANEHWDDPLPLRMGGRDAFWNWYQGLTSSPTGQMNNYDEDTVQKRFSLLAWLAEADYIVLSSNRLYASIPRLAQRYPLTAAYYRYLFDGSLGFELAAEFVSYPRLGPCQFPNQEMPFALQAPRTSNAAPCSIALPPAEEAFSVYDHPTVLIFRKTPRFSVAAAEALLPRSLVNEARWMTPREATRSAPPDENALLLSSRMRAAQEAGGTWSSMFNTNALQNRSQRMAIVLWALLVTLLGWIAFPLVYHAFPSLHSRGYGLSRAIGVLLWSYLAWMLASLRILPYTRPVLWVLIALLTLISAWVAWRHRLEFQTFIATRWRSILLVDAIFLSLFLLWVGVRWLNPDLWHPVVGGEKPMDFAYYNAVIKSTWFPPYDPWFAGGQLNYYYFGFVIVGSLTKALGIVPSVAYNLAIPTLFALTGVGGYVLASNLARGDAKRWRRAGIWGVIAVVILGNLGEIRLILNGLATVGDVTFESLIPGYPEAVSTLVGLWKVVVEGARLPFRPEWWYWDPTRIIPVQPGEVGPINEFPAFTYLYGDLHAHAMALPLTQVALAVAIQWAVGVFRLPSAAVIANVAPSRWRTLLGWALPRPVGSLLVAGLVAGALRATNTWDYPTYLALMSVGFLIGLISSRSRAGEDGRHPTGSGWDKRILLGLATPALLLACAELLFRPFTATYQVPYAAFDLWPGSRTPLGIYLLMYGPFLLPVVVGALAGLVRVVRLHLRQLRAPQDREGTRMETCPVTDEEPTQVRSDSGRWVESALWLAVVVLAAVVLLVVLVGYFEAPVAWLAVPLGLTAAGLVLAPQVPLRHRLLWFWVGTALALSLLVEVAVLRGDIGRMNTVFKFHLQVWMLLALSGAVFIERLLHAANGLGDLLRLNAVSPNPSRTEPAEGTETPGAASARLSVANDVIAIITAGLIFCAALYPVFAIPAKIRDRWVPDAPHTLDGMTFMKYAVQYERDTELRTEADHRVIRWLQENVEGSPTIVEGLGEREYLWGNRISIYTGLPTVVGWRWHQVQQRMVMPGGTVEARQQDVRLFYNTTDPEVAHAILEKYQVSFVILGPYERAYTLPDGLPKFDEMVTLGWLEVVYADEASTVYRVVA